MAEIQTEDEYKAALREVSVFFENEPEPGTPDGERFEALVSHIQAYEAKHVPIDLPEDGLARRSLSGVLAKFAKFSMDFMTEGRGDQEQEERGKGATKQ